MHSTTSIVFPLPSLYRVQEGSDKGRVCVASPQPPPPAPSTDLKGALHKRKQPDGYSMCVIDPSCATLFHGQIPPSLSKQIAEQSKTHERKTKQVLLPMVFLIFQSTFIVTSLLLEYLHPCAYLNASVCPNSQQDLDLLGVVDAV